MRATTTSSSTVPCRTAAPAKRSRQPKYFSSGVAACGVELLHVIAKAEGVPLARVARNDHRDRRPQQSSRAPTSRSSTPFRLQIHARRDGRRARGSPRRRIQATVTAVRNDRGRDRRREGRLHGRGLTMARRYRLRHTRGCSQRDDERGAPHRPFRRSRLRHHRAPARVRTSRCRRAARGRAVRALDRHRPARGRDLHATRTTEPPDVVRRGAACRGYVLFNAVVAVARLVGPDALTLGRPGMLALAVGGAALGHADRRGVLPVLRHASSARCRRGRRSGR